MLGTKNIMFMEFSPEETMGRWYFFTYGYHGIELICKWPNFYGEIDDKWLKNEGI